jgi:2-polyprenyl-3-methyl-5-hydroxy-6-metoxy-1,4-benzoquinol methylase
MTTSTERKSSTYVFDQAWQKELERLRSIEGLFDPASQRHLAALGVGAGWQCLEVGCGAGSIALWLAERVGPRGSVLAIDLDPRFLEGHGRSNLTVMRHDVTTDPLAPASFDLIHARAVLVHLRDPEAVLRRLMAALRPGGWLVIEDVDFGGTAAEMIARYTVPTTEVGFFERGFKAIAEVFTRVGADPTFGSRVPGLLTHVGLQDIGAEIHAPLLSGTPRGNWVSLTLEHLRPRLAAAGLLSESELEAMHQRFFEPTVRYLPPFVITAWGRRGSS